MASDIVDLTLDDDVGPLTRRVSAPEGLGRRFPTSERAESPEKPSPAPPGGGSSSSEHHGLGAAARPACPPGPPGDGDVATASADRRPGSAEVIVLVDLQQEESSPQQEQQRQWAGEDGADQESPCLREYIAGKAKERIWPITCPDPSCKAPISLDECRLVLSAEEGEDLGRAATEAAIDGAERMFCPNPQCSQLLIVERAPAGAGGAGGAGEQAPAPAQERSFDCPHCGKAVCAACGVLWHRDLSCAEYQALPQELRSEGDRGLMALAAQKSWKACPGCRNMVEKSMGCNHVRCRCGVEMCFECGAKWGDCQCRNSVIVFGAHPPTQGTAAARAGVGPAGAGALADGGALAGVPYLNALVGALGAPLGGAMPLLPPPPMPPRRPRQRRRQRQQARQAAAEARQHAVEQARRLAAEAQWQAEARQLEEQEAALRRRAKELERLMAQVQRQQQQQVQQQVQQVQQQQVGGWRPGSGR
eukprot:scaffold1.g5528.t1